MDLFLDVDRRRVRYQIGPILLVLASPDQLRVQVAVAALIGYADWALLPLVHHGLEFGGGNILSRSLLMSECFNCLLFLWFGCTVGHEESYAVVACAET